MSRQLASKWQDYEPNEQFINDIFNWISLYNTIHCFSNLWCFPYQHNNRIFHFSKQYHQCFKTTTMSLEIMNKPNYFFLTPCLMSLSISNCLWSTLLRKACFSKYLEKSILGNLPNWQAKSCGIRKIQYCIIMLPHWSLSIADYLKDHSYPSLLLVFSSSSIPSSLLNEFQSNLDFSCKL